MEVNREAYNFYENGAEIGRLERDPARLKSLYELGRQDALAALPAMKRFLGAEGEA